MYCVVDVGLLIAPVVTEMAYQDRKVLYSSDQSLNMPILSTEKVFPLVPYVSPMECEEHPPLCTYSRLHSPDLGCRRAAPRSLFPAHTRTLYQLA